ncbi:MAG: fumarate hydratase [Dehalococcoidia bacterium]|nr:fumarate hydratase [Dehalococcoidia bacterium]
MREITTTEITDTVKRLFQEANYYLPDDVVASIEKARTQEESPLGKDILGQILENQKIARTQQIALCQDTGTSCVFLDLGQDVHVTGGGLYDAVNEGIRQAYTTGFLRASIADHPFSSRTNTKDNTPGVIHTEIVAGDQLGITVMPKGGGCENMSQIKVLLPGAGKAGISQFICDVIEESGGNPCPPLIVGVGIGGTAEYAMYLAKKSLLRKVEETNPDPETAGFEAELLTAVNKLGLGPQAVGGTQTALAVHVETYPTHITALPVAVNLQCHSARTKHAVL